jgi:hypothetical protein
MITTTHESDFSIQNDLNTHECDYDTHDSDFDTQECNLDTHECYLNMLRVTLKLINYNYFKITKKKIGLGSD